MKKKNHIWGRFGDCAFKTPEQRLPVSPLCAGRSPRPCWEFSAPSPQILGLLGADFGCCQPLGELQRGNFHTSGCPWGGNPAQPSPSEFAFPKPLQICFSKTPLEDAAAQGAAPTCTKECPHALKWPWGLWGQLVALSSRGWVAQELQPFLPGSAGGCCS